MDARSNNATTSIASENKRKRSLLPSFIYHSTNNVGKILVHKDTGIEIAEGTWVHYTGSTKKETKFGPVIYKKSFLERHSKNYNKKKLSSSYVFENGDPVVDESRMEYDTKGDKYIDGKLVITYSAWFKRQYIFKDTHEYVHLSEGEKIVTVGPISKVNNREVITLGHYYETTETKTYVYSSTYKVVKHNNIEILCGGKRKTEKGTRKNVITMDAFLKREFVFGDTQEPLSIDEKKELAYRDHDEVSLDGRPIIRLIGRDRKRQKTFHETTSQVSEQNVVPENSETIITSTASDQPLNYQDEVKIFENILKEMMKENPQDEPEKTADSLQDTQGQELIGENIKKKMVAASVDANSLQNTQDQELIPKNVSTAIDSETVENLAKELAADEQPFYKTAFRSNSPITLFSSRKYTPPRILSDDEDELSDSLLNMLNKDEEEEFLDSLLHRSSPR